MLNCYYGISIVCQQFLTIFYISFQVAKKFSNMPQMPTTHESGTEEEQRLAV